MLHSETSLCWRVLASTGLSAGDGNSSDGPIRTASGTTENIDWLSGRSDATSHAIEMNLVDLDSIGRVSLWPTVEIILLDIDAVICNITQSDIAVSNILNKTLWCSSDRLDAKSIITIGDF